MEVNIEKVLQGLRRNDSTYKSDQDIIRDAISLIKELTEERDRYKRYYLNHEYDKFEAEVKADTVRRMQAEIEARCIKGGIYPAFVKSTIDRIVEEMLEDDDGT